MNRNIDMLELNEDGELDIEDLRNLAVTPVEHLSVAVFVHASTEGDRRHHWALGEILHEKILELAGCLDKLIDEGCRIKRLPQ